MWRRISSTLCLLKSQARSLNQAAGLQSVIFVLLEFYVLALAIAVNMRGALPAQRLANVKACLLSSVHCNCKQLSQQTRMPALEYLLGTTATCTVYCRKLRASVQ